MTDLDRLLKNLENDIARDTEIERILHCCPNDYFSILQINPIPGLENLPNQIKKLYRRKSLLIHPDKTTHQDGPKAFAMLEKAHRILSRDDSLDGLNTTEDGNTIDDDERAERAEKKALVDIYNEVESRLLLPKVIPYDHDTNHQIREKVRLVLQTHAKTKQIDHSYAQREELQKQDAIRAAAMDRDSKKKWETRWEQDRGARVKLWRDFNTKVSKPKKKKKVLA